MTESLTAEEEAHLRQCSSLGGEDLRRVWATLDAVRAERDEAKFKLDVMFEVVVSDVWAKAGARLIAEREEARAERDEARAETARLQSLVDSYKAPDAEAVLRAMLSPKDPRG